MAESYKCIFQQMSELILLGMLKREIGTSELHSSG